MTIEGLPGTIHDHALIPELLRLQTPPTKILYPFINFFDCGNAIKNPNRKP